MGYIEDILAVLLVLTYIVGSKWLLSTILNYWMGITKYTSDWFSYVVVIVIIPAILYYCFNYEVTALAIGVFVIYSAYWLCTRAYKRAFYIF